MKKVTINKIKKALKTANWEAMRCTQLEARVCIDDDNEIVIRWEPQGSNSWYTKSMIYKTFCYWPSVEDVIGGPANAVNLRWLQGEYIRGQLDFDAEDIFKEYSEKMEG